MRESARIISQDSDESDESVRHKIRRGLKEVGHNSPITTESDKEAENIIEKENTWPKCIQCKTRKVVKNKRTNKPQGRENEIDHRRRA